jgi:hypothetical protein
MEPPPHKPTPSLHPEQIWLHAWINIAINKFICFLVHVPVKLTQQYNLNLLIAILIQACSQICSGWREGVGLCGGGSINLQCNRVLLPGVKIQTFLIIVQL